MQCYAAGRRRQASEHRGGHGQRQRALSGPRLRLARLGGRDSPVLPQPARAGNVARHAAPPVHFAIDQTRPPALPACLPACLLCLQHYISYATLFIICIPTSLYSSCYILNLQKINKYLWQPHILYSSLK